MPELVFADRLQGSSATILVIFIVVIFGAMVVLSYFVGKRSWRASIPGIPTPHRRLGGAAQPR